MSPFAPVAPAAPSAPGGPAAPSRPAGPALPCAPAGPVIPMGPLGPVGPLEPAGPRGPTRPVGGPTHSPAELITSVLPIETVDAFTVPPTTFLALAAMSAYATESMG